MRSRIQDLTHRKRRSGIREFEPIEDALRTVTGDPEPGPNSFDLAAASLEARMSGPRPSKLSPRSKWSFGAVAVGIPLAVGLALLIPPALRVSEVRAAVEGVARATELVEPATITETEFFYVKTTRSDLGVLPADLLEDTPYDGDVLVGLFPVTRETWYGRAGAVQIRSVRLPPTFFSPDAESAYYDAGLDEMDQIGVVETETVTLPTPPRQWPEDPKELIELLKSEASTGRDLPEEVEQLESGLRLLRDAFATPIQRATVLRWIGNLAGMQLAETKGGALALAGEYMDAGMPTQFSIEFDQEGWLIAEQRTVLHDGFAPGVPAGTAVSSATYSKPVIVRTLE